MADSYNPFYVDDEEDAVEDSIVAAVEAPTITQQDAKTVPVVGGSDEPVGKAVVAGGPVQPTEPSYDVIATKLLKVRRTMTMTDIILMMLLTLVDLCRWFTVVGLCMEVYAIHASFSVL